MTRVIVVARDLIVASRISEAVLASGARVERLDSLDDLPSPEAVAVVFVDWGERSPDWGERLTIWCADAPPDAAPRIVLFGPHTDLEAHAAARASGLGPMVARSRLMSLLPKLFPRVAG